MNQVASLDFKDVSVNNFYRSIHIYLKKTQVVNRKLSCSSNVSYLKLKLPSVENYAKQIFEAISSDDKTTKSALLSLGIEFSGCSLDDLKDYDESQEGIFLSIDRMVPRNLQKFKTCHIATFIGEKNELFSETCI